MGSSDEIREQLPELLVGTNGTEGAVRTPGPVLVVDGDAASRDLLSHQLMLGELAVETAAGGHEALAFLRLHPAELVLLDVQLPDMSALDVLKEIRLTWSSSALPVLMVTAKNPSEEIVEALGLGADDYITRPIDYAVALARVQTQLLRKQTDVHLRASEQCHTLAAEDANDGLWDWDLERGTIQLSPRWKALVGAAEDDIGNDPNEWLERVHRDDRARVQASLDAHLAGDSSRFECEYRIQHQSGTFRWVLVRGLAVRNAEGVAVRIAGSQVDFTAGLARVQTQLLREQADAHHRANGERYALAAGGANDGLWDWDLERGTIQLSPRWKALVGAAEDDIGDDPNEWLERVHPDDRARVQASLDAHLAGDSSRFECEHRIRHQSGTFRWVLVRGLAVRNSEGVAVRIAGSQVDLTPGKVLDPLTGLPNHLLLNDQLEKALLEQARHGKERCAVFLFALDGLKLINDSLGHHAGDEVIRAVAGRLEASLRPGDTVVRASASSFAGSPLASAHTLARSGGDEFIILLPDIRAASDVTRVADRLQQIMVRPFDVLGQQVFVTASLGIALSRSGDCSAQELLRDADTALHRAKLSGSGRFEVFDATMRKEVQQRLHLETDLRMAVDRDEFTPYFQPVVDLRTGRLAGFEALLRWRHPTRGIVSPSEFVPAMETNGLIVPVGRRCFELVCRQVREWLDAHACPDRFWASVNFSRQQFLEDGLVPWLIDCLQRARVSPANIAIEITESAAIENLDLTTRVLRQLGEAGLRVLMDDFGTGHSSLVCLHQLPLGGLKMDRTLMLATEKHPALLRTVVALANSLRLTVTAEGVETEAQCRRVAEGGCHLAQGFIFKAPVDGKQAAEIIRENQVWLPELLTSAPVLAGRPAGEPRLTFVS